MEPYLANVVLSGGVLKRSDLENKTEIIEQLIVGERQVSLANYEPQKGFNLDNVDCEISDDGSVSGLKTTVLNAPNADFFHCAYCLRAYTNNSFKNCLMQYVQSIRL